MDNNEVNDPIEQDSEELSRFNLSRGRVLARMGNRQPAPRKNPQRHVRPSKGSLHDHRH